MPTPGKGYWLDGKRLPSVTTVIKKFDSSDALVGWAYSKGYEDAMQGNPPDRYARSEEAKDIGTYAHALIEAHLYGVSLKELIVARPKDFEKLPVLEPDELERAEATYGAYLTWERHTGIEVVSLEVPLMCACHRYGGTPDAVGMIDFDHSLVDFKSSNGVYVSMIEQLAAYKHLWNVNFPTKAIEGGGAHLLRLPKEGGDFHHHFYADLDDAWQSFLYKRELYDLHQRLEKRVK